jgi:predicted small lipoprotein YifL
MTAKKICTIALAAAMLLALGACGVKNDLLRPDGKPAPHDQKDPSRPPAPIE